MPRVSLLMAVHNGKGYLPAAIDSILAQTFCDFEFVILDDGSTDGSTELLQTYAAKDNRIRLISRPNKGLTPSLNEGLKLCTADLIARMDGDDFAMPDRLAKQVAFMDANPHVVLLGGAYDLIDGRGRLLTTMRPPTDDATLQQQCLAGTTPICHPLAMFRRDVAMTLGGYDVTFAVAQDLEFWLRLGEAGKLACLPDVLLQYRMHEKSVSERKQTLQVNNIKRAIEAAWKRRALPGSPTIQQAGWRSTGDSGSTYRQTMRFGWWAWHRGENKTARAYGRAAIAMKPLGGDGWKLLLSGLLRRSPRAGAAS